MATGNTGYVCFNRLARGPLAHQMKRSAKLTFWRIPLHHCRTFPASHWLVVGRPANQSRARRWYFSPTWKFAQMSKTWSVMPSVPGLQHTTHPGLFLVSLCGTGPGQACLQLRRQNITNSILASRYFAQCRGNHTASQTLHCYLQHCLNLPV